MSRGQKSCIDCGSEVSGVHDGACFVTCTHGATLVDGECACEPTPAARVRSGVRVLLLALALGACAHGSAIVTGVRGPSTTAASVEVFLKPPAHYDPIALVTAKSVSGWTTEGGQAQALEELKAQAAKVGANAVILTGTEEGSRGLFTGGSQTVSGMAIRVSR